MTYDPLSERQSIQSSWSSIISTLHSGEKTNVDPLQPYFFDHYGYLLYLSRRTTLDLGEPKYFYACHARHNKDTWQNRLSEFVGSCSAWSEDEVPRLDEPLPRNEIIETLLQHWSDWVSGLGVSVPENHFEIPEKMTWEAFYQDSVHYPDRPAIAGPTFFQRTTSAQQHEIVSRYGEEGPTALYIVLLRTHEKSHFLQRGCPLLSELSLSALWGRFLTEFDQWFWQKNEETQVAFNLEWFFTSRDFMSAEAWAGIFSDTYEGLTDLEGAKAMEKYSKLRQIAHSFFLKKLRYADYVEQSCDLLAQR